VSLDHTNVLDKWHPNPSNCSDSGVDKNHDFLNKNRKHRFFDDNEIFFLKSIFFIFIRFLHHSMLSVITNVLPLSVSLWMTVIGLD